MITTSLTLALAKKVDSTSHAGSSGAFLFVLQPHRLLTLTVTSGSLIAAEVNDLVKQT